MRKGTTSLPLTLAAAATARGAAGEHARICHLAGLRSPPALRTPPALNQGVRLENLDCACALTLAGITSRNPQAEQRRGQRGSPWLFHGTREGEHGEGKACRLG
jgi:hypothetical protein